MVKNGSLSSAALDEAVRRLVAEFRPCRVLLFGSHAAGTAHERSDIDVLVLLDDEQTPLLELSRRGYGALRGLGLPVELHFHDRGRFERRATVRGSFEHEVQRHARVLHVA